MVRSSSEMYFIYKKISIIYKEIFQLLPSFQALPDLINHPGTLHSSELRQELLGSHQIIGFKKLPMDTTEPSIRSHLFVPFHGSNGRWILSALHQTPFSLAFQPHQAHFYQAKERKAKEKIYKWMVAASRQNLTFATVILDSCSHYICVTPSAYIESGSIFLGKLTRTGALAT